MQKKSLNVDFQLKQIDDVDPEFFVFEGFASVFGMIDDVGDTIVPGAFKKSIEEKLPIILWQHRWSEPIGMPIEIKETKEGLFLKAKLPRSDDLVNGRVIPQMKTGSIKSMSIGFWTLKSSRDEETDIRTLIEVDLLEISLVTFPADPKALVTDFKSKNNSINVEKVKKFSKRELEKALRESGFSKDAAMFVVKDFAESGEPSSDKETKEALKRISESLDSFNKQLLTNI